MAINKMAAKNIFSIQTCYSIKVSPKKMFFYQEMYNMITFNSILLLLKDNMPLFYFYGHLIVRFLKNQRTK